ncbi:hypothetical protein RA307_00175 [Xanthobacteraceae bacterium Astr-EGSB]|uniref:hypothetical protein n=1 Tax=Astrobacterium formosum TaxID=3069710 RepID=UPI0027B06C56|nr:hypothetical protein [Xanthobacteraceae bacterium Astr-EGSB]
MTFDMERKGILVIRSDIPLHIEADYLAWLSREHTHERLSVEGFRSARIFRCGRKDVRRYLIIYDLDSPAVLDSPAYLQRLNAPTPWSARMMPHMGAFVRCGGAILATAGAGSGTAMLPVMIGGEAFDMAEAAVAELADQPGIVAVRLVQADAKRTLAPTRERNLRGGDGIFEGVLLIEALSIDAALAVIADLPLRKSIEETQLEDAAYLEVFHLGG